MITYNTHSKNVHSLDIIMLKAENNMARIIIVLNDLIERQWQISSVKSIC